MVPEPGFEPGRPYGHGILRQSGKGGGSRFSQFVALSRVRGLRGVLYSPRVMVTQMDTCFGSHKIAGARRTLRVSSALSSATTSWRLPRSCIPVDRGLTNPPPLRWVEWALARPDEVCRVRLFEVGFAGFCKPEPLLRSSSQAHVRGDRWCEVQIVPVEPEDAQDSG